MARTLKSDRLLFWATLLLVGAGLVMVYSASAVQAQAAFKVPYYFLFRQLAWAAIGFVLFRAGMRVDYHAYRRPIVIWTLLGGVTVALILVFLFQPVNNTRRWLMLGPLSVQPSEFAKLAAIFFAAALLDRRMHRVNDFGYVLVPTGLVTLSLAGLIFKEPDFGTATVLVLVVMAIVFAAGLRYRYLFGSLLVGMPAAVGLMLSSTYRRNRLAAFIDPSKYQLTYGFQTIQSMIAIGSGGLFGRGLMGGVQKLYYIPEPQTDFIYAVIGEELGLVGTLLVLVCFLVIAWRGLRAALLAPDRFGALLALGLTAMVVVQAFVNISVVLNLLPDKGLPLPFVSNGGSSLVVNLIAMGILLNISQHASPTAETAVEGRA